MPTVDADGHVLEPRDTWQKYLEPQLRDRAIRIVEDIWECAAGWAVWAASAWTPPT
jgi:hypothetical protein